MALSVSRGVSIGAGVGDSTAVSVIVGDSVGVGLGVGDSVGDGYRIELFNISKNIETFSMYRI